jgi:hypothetical protein
MEESGMTGLFLLVVVLAWLVAVVFLTNWLMKRVSIKPKPVRAAMAMMMFVVLLPLPVADEIVGGFQYRALCEKNAVLRIDEAKAEGRTVKVVVDPSNEILPGTAITIYHSHLSFFDVRTNEKIAEYDRYVAKGGWFIRMLGISEGNAPITIGLPGCSPNNSGTFPKQHGLTLIN